MAGWLLKRELRRMLFCVGGRGGRFAKSDGIIEVFHNKMRFIQRQANRL